MPRLVTRNPKYRKHKASGQAVVTLNGDDVYLGPHGTQASRDEYDRRIAEWHASGRRRSRGTDSLYVLPLIKAYETFAAAYYRRADGTDTGECGSIRQALQPLARLYGRTLAADFSPMALKAVRDEMVRMGWARRYINAQVNRLRRMFKWGVENELVEAGVLHGLQAVAPLKLGRSDAPESEPVTPVAEEYVAAVRPHVSRQVWAMIELQLVTGMRPGEVLKMRTCDVDTTGNLWTYTPPTHKTAHHGHQRVIYFGPRGIAILKKWLRANVAEPLFQPAEADAEKRAARFKARKTPLSCGNRPGTNRRPKPQCKPGDAYNLQSYARAITRACEVAFGMPKGLRTRKAKRSPETRALAAAWRATHCWHPNQLRHTAATRMRREHGLEAAQVLLGHKTLTVTQIYAEKNVEAAKRVAMVAG